MKIKFLMAAEGTTASTTTPAVPAAAGATPAAPPAAPPPTPPADGSTPPPAAVVGDLIGGKTAQETAPDAKAYEVVLPDDLKDYVKGMDTYVAKAMELKVPPEAFKGLIDHHFAQMREQAKGVKEAQDKAFNATVESWKSEVVKDPEIGGAKLSESLQLATKGAITVGGQEFVDALRKSGLSNWPPLVRAMRKVGELISDDKIGGIGGKRSDPTEEDIAKEREQKLFPSHYTK